MVTKAKADLNSYRTSFGQLINSVIPELPAAAVAKELIPHVQTLLDAIDAAIAGSPDYQTKLAMAADHMSMTADILAGGIAKDKHLAGNVDGTGSATRAALTAQLTNHVWLAGNALDTAVLKGGNLKDPAVAGAVAALDANSVTLSKTVGSVYPAAEAPFLASWRQHIGFFVNYTLGKATKNAAMVTKAKADLNSYRTSFGQLINSVIPELPAAAVAKELDPARADADRRHRRRHRRQPGLPDQAVHGRRPHEHDRSDPHRRHRRQQEDHQLVTPTWCRPAASAGRHQVRSTHSHRSASTVTEEPP